MTLKVIQILGMKIKSRSWFRNCGLRVKMKPRVTVKWLVKASETLKAGYQRALQRDNQLSKDFTGVPSRPCYQSGP